MRTVRSACLLLLFSCANLIAADNQTGMVVFSEQGFPAAESAQPSPAQLEGIFPGARFASLEQSAAFLKDPATRLLVLPYGSAFPEGLWPTISAFVQRGGNLLVLGGRPFTRSAYRDATGWKLRDYSVRFTRPLMIDQYETTPGSSELEFQSNPDARVQMPVFTWSRAFSPVIRLSSIDLYHRGGAAGSIDAKVQALAWGVKNGRKLSAPALQIDHLRNGFGGGRWIFLNAELPPDFYSRPGTPDLVRQLADLALRGSEEFAVRPEFPLYLPGEPIQLAVSWQSAQPNPPALTIKISTFPQNQPQSRTDTTSPVPAASLLALPPPKAPGLYVVNSELWEGGKLRAVDHSGFWVRDENYLRSGPRLAVNRDYFELDGQPLPVVGTTYMSSEVQRLFFDHPNVYVWDRDLSAIHAAGLNMIRTGWWTGWDKLCDENGQPYERTLRTLEAYLMTARKNNLPVQFNFFAFLPDVLSGVNSYLDPEAVRRQQTLISAVVTRFRDVPWLAWDLINEPSISRHLWTMRPNGDPFEVEKWNQWISQRYPDRTALGAAWNLPVSAVEGMVALPEEIDFAPRGMYVGHNSLKVYDYFLFAQDVFANWTRANRDQIRSTGSKQLVTVGQDEGGIQDRLSPAYWGQFVDFTTNHTWWQNDFVLWSSLMAKQPGETLLIQETGLQRELNLDEVARRTPQNEAALLERKIATSFIQGSGAIEWLWNTNSYMTESNETPIGAVRPDATEKPEATVLRDFAVFSQSLSPHLRNPQRPPIVIVTSQAAQFSVMADLQLEAQRTAVRALAYNDHLAAYAIAENQIEHLGTPKLAILPSPQALTEKAWQALLQYVDGGGSLLITGPVEEDEHWHKVNRALQLHVDAHAEPLTYHNSSLRLNDRPISLSFDQTKQTWLESLRFQDGSTLKEIPHGQGRIFWAAYPVELAEGTQPAADLYAYIAARLGITPAFDLQSPLPLGVLVFPTVLEDSVFYVVVSDNADPTKIDLRDKLTGAKLAFQLESQHAALAIIGRKEKSVVAKYGY